MLRKKLSDTQITHYNEFMDDLMPTNDAKTQEWQSRLLSHPDLVDIVDINRLARTKHISPVMRDAMSYRLFQLHYANKNLSKALIFLNNVNIAKFNGYGMDIFKFMDESYQMQKANHEFFKFMRAITYNVLMSKNNSQDVMQEALERYATLTNPLTDIIIAFHSVIQMYKDYYQERIRAGRTSGEYPRKALVDAVTAFEAHPILNGSYKNATVADVTKLYNDFNAMLTEKYMPLLTVFFRGTIFITMKEAEAKMKEIGRKLLRLKAYENAFKDINIEGLKSALKVEAVLPAFLVNWVPQLHAIFDVTTHSYRYLLPVINERCELLHYLDPHTQQQYAMVQHPTNQFLQVYETANVYTQQVSAPLQTAIATHHSPEPELMSFNYLDLGRQTYQSPEPAVLQPEIVSTSNQTRSQLPISAAEEIIPSPNAVDCSRPVYSQPAPASMFHHHVESNEVEMKEIISAPVTLTPSVLNTNNMQNRLSSLWADPVMQGVKHPESSASDEKEIKSKKVKVQSMAM